MSSLSWFCYDTRWSIYVLELYWALAFISICILLREKFLRWFQHSLFSINHDGQCSFRMRSWTPLPGNLSIPRNTYSEIESPWRFRPSLLPTPTAWEPVDHGGPLKPQHNSQLFKKKQWTLIIKSPPLLIKKIINHHLLAAIKEREIIYNYMSNQ